MRSAQPPRRMTLFTPLLVGALLIAGCADSGHATHAGTAEAAPTLTATGVAARASHPRSPASPPPAAPRAPARAAAAPQARAGQSKPAPPSPPRIVQSPIPFGVARKAEMARYAHRHYGLHSYLLRSPRVIVIHYTETPDFQSTFNTFAPDTPDAELHELPNTCAHFVIDRDGTIHQLVPLSIMCRHTVGLNWTAIGIEHVGYSDGEVLHRTRQMRASLSLTRWLRCRFQIQPADVIGHNESLSSPYHHENVPALRTQTHSDFNHADMNVYRSRLRSAGGC